MTDKTGAISSKDKHYPELLKLIPDYPERLFYKGGFDSALFKNCLAVVGSRRMSSYGERAIEKLFSEISDSNITIVSGFMFGVDAKAHEIALEFGLKTIAVMAGGVENITPAYQDKLYRRILELGGLIVSEFEGDISPKKWSFPRRNRIIAGLSKAVLVVECTANSGTLITTEYMKKYERSVLAVPGNIDSKLSEGCLQLIKEGARIAISGIDISACCVEENKFGNSKNKFDLTDSTQKQRKAVGGLVQEKILAELAIEPLTVDSLIERTGIKSADINSQVIRMELGGSITGKDGKYYAN